MFILSLFYLKKKKFSQILPMIKWNPVWTVYSSQNAANALYFLLKTAEDTMKYNVLPVGFVGTVCCRRFYQGGCFEWDQMNPRTSCCCWFRAGVLGRRDLQWGSFQHMKLCWLTYSTFLGGSLALTSAQFNLEESNLLSYSGSFRFIHQNFASENKKERTITFIISTRQIYTNKCKQATVSL